MLSAPDGACFIETSTLDGEKNLKKRLLPAGFPGNLTAAHFRGNMLSREPPHKDLYKFQGKLDRGGGESHPLSIKQLLLKGAFLRNTEWVLAAVVYTGFESKIMLNSQKRH